MDDIDTILVVVERGAQSYPELERAAELAEALEARLYLLVRAYDSVLYWHYLFGKRGDKLSQQAYEREAQSWVDDQAEALRDQGIAADGEAVWSRHLYPAIQARVEELEPGLVIKGANADPVNGAHSAYNATDWQLMRRCTVPVLLVHYQTRALHGAILCAVNPAHPDAGHRALDHRIMSIGRVLSERLDRFLHLFNCFQPPTEYVAPPTGVESAMVQDHLEDLERSHTQQLNDFVADYHLPTTNVHRSEGDPAEQLPVLAERLPASLVIMGVVSRSALPELLIGHTAERVLDHLECDILAVKPATDDT